MKTIIDSEWTVKTGRLQAVAKTPFTDYSALLSANLIPDPFIGDNEKKSLWISETDTVCSTRFDYDGETKGAYLVLEAVDTVFTATLNGTPIGGGANAFIDHRFPVDGVLKRGENLLELVIAAPKVAARAEMKRINSGATAGVTEITFLRKPQYQFGWDWGPEIPVSGIYGSVYIDTDEVRITDMKVDTVFDNSAVTLHVSAEFTGAADGYILSVTAPDGTVVDKRGIAGSDNKVDRDFLIDNPMIWEIADISGGKKQPLYTVKLCLTKGKDNYVATKRIGIRKLRLIRDKLPDGSDFCFELNGRRIFAKGANWIPADAMPDRIDEEVFRYHLQASVNAGFNMVRVWGGGFYEHDKFYDICDELGLLVWQDCAVACRPCPFYDEKYLKNMLSEIDFNVKRLRHHPSLALWCGNNELEDMSINWITSRKYIDCTYDFFYRILPGELERLGAGASYIPGSPIGADYQKGVKADNVGDTHLWAVWHGLQDIEYYRTRKTRFCSEFGFESFPDVRTVRYYAGENENDLFSDVMKIHQKCALGNEKTVYYTSALFKTPEKFEDKIYFSQLAQAESIRDATEAWRRSQQTWGALYWQLNDCWPVASWSSIDYFGRFKALQYAAKRFNAPFTVGAECGEEAISIFVLNDYPVEKSGTVAVKIQNFSGKTELENKFEVVAAPCSRTKIAEIPLRFTKRQKKTLFYVAELLENGKSVARVSKPMLRDSACVFPKPDYTVESAVTDGNTHIFIRAKNYLRLAEVYTDADTPPYSDNFMDILPGEEKEIIVAGTYPGTEFKVRSVGAVKTVGNPVTELIKRAKIFFNPVNFFSWLYWRTAKFEYKDQSEE